ncbi:MAG: CvpA family protein [Bacillota bacterium]
MNLFSWLDLIIGLFLLFSLVRGIAAGLIKSITDLAGAAAGLAAASRYYASGGTLLLSYLNLMPYLADLISFLVILISVFAVVALLGSLIACPVVLSRQRLRFDCGSWSNGSFHRPTGTCPVCGERG